MSVVQCYRSNSLVLIGISAISNFGFGKYGMVSPILEHKREENQSYIKGFNHTEKLQVQCLANQTLGAMLPHKHLLKRKIYLHTQTYLHHTPELIAMERLTTLLMNLTHNGFSKPTGR